MAMVDDAWSVDDLDRRGGGIFSETIAGLKRHIVFAGTMAIRRFASNGIKVASMIASAGSIAAADHLASLVVDDAPSGGNDGDGGGEDRIRRADRDNSLRRQIGDQRRHDGPHDSRYLVLIDHDAVSFGGATRTRAAASTAAFAAAVRAIATSRR
jgi:hypothetical protein